MRLTEAQIDAMNPFQFDMALLEAVHEIIATGIRIDHDEMQRMSVQAHTKWAEMQSHLDAISGGALNVSSPKQMREWFYGSLGMKVRTSRGTKKPTTNEDALRSIMADAGARLEQLKTDSAKHRWKLAFVTARLVLNIRGIRKQISSYLDIDLDNDGRVRSTITVGGTETARFSHSKTLWDTGLNIATVPRKQRVVYIADDGYELAQIDLNRGESWVYAHLSGDEELLRIHRTGADFHSETAAAISKAFGDAKPLQWIIDNKEGEAYKLRYLGKRVNHASAYRMGPGQGANVVNAEADETGIVVSQSQFKTAQAIWRELYPSISGVWWPSIEQKLSLDRTMVTPYDRIREFHGWWGKSLFKEATAYVPQSTSVDYMNRGLLKVYHLFQKTGAWGLKILTQTHDSILIQYRTEDRDECLPEVMRVLESRPIRIRGMEFIIPVEAEYGQSWGKLEGYHV